LIPLQSLARAVVVESVNTSPAMADAVLITPLEGAQFSA
jgi:hypothetical protein